MKKFILFLIFVFLLPSVLGFGGWDEGGWDEGGWDFGTPAPEPTPSSTPSSAASRGGRGGYYEPPKKEVVIDSKTIEISLSQGESYKIMFKNQETHNITINKLYSDRADISVFSERQTATLYVGENRLFVFGNLDFIVNLKRIIGGSVTFTLTDSTDYSKFGIVEDKELPVEQITETPKEVIEVEGEIKLPEQPQEVPQKPKYKLGIWLFAGVILLILFVASFKFGKYVINSLFKKDKEKQEKKSRKDDTEKGNKREDKH